MVSKSFQPQQTRAHTFLSVKPAKFALLENFHVEGLDKGIYLKEFSRSSRTSAAVMFLSVCYSQLKFLVYVS